MNTCVIARSEPSAIVLKRRATRFAEELQRSDKSIRSPTETIKLQE